MVVVVPEAAVFEAVGVTVVAAGDGAAVLVDVAAVVADEIAADDSEPGERQPVSASAVTTATPRTQRHKVKTTGA
jgi:hypothetical protein